MLHYYEVIGLAIAHYAGDYYFQTSEIAEGKSKDNSILLTHIIIYSIFQWIAFSVMVNNEIKALAFTFITAIIHFIQDYFTSRWAREMKEMNNMSMYFKILGFDQLFHTVQLVSTYAYLT